MSEGLKEKHIVKQIMDYLALRGVFHFRNNTGAMQGEYGGKKWFVRFGLPGAPDIFALRNGRLYGIECKRPGAKQSDEQVEYQRKFEKAGGYYVLARDLVDVQAVMER